MHAVLELPYEKCHRARFPTPETQTPETRTAETQTPEPQPDWESELEEVFNDPKFPKPTRDETCFSLRLIAMLDHLVGPAWRELFPKTCTRLATQSSYERGVFSCETHRG